MKIKIKNKIIGEDSPVFIIAEIGYNFNNLEEAKKAIDKAKECKVDAVKFQTFKAETIVSKEAYFPEEAGGTNQFEEFKKYEINEEFHKEIFDYSVKKGLIAFSTPSFYDDVDLLERLNVPLYKVGADDLTNLPFLKYIAKLGKPMIISTGMANLSETAEAVETIFSTGNKNLIILHCLSNYPVKNLNYLNLRAIQTLKQAFSCIIGFSDHTQTISAPLAAVALGAKVIERHFTFNKNLNAPDAYFSTDPDEMKMIIKGIREIEKMLGDGIKKAAKTELNMRLQTRKSLIALKEIKKGEILSKKNTIIKRPGFGIEPKDYEKILGKKVKRNIRKDEVITWENIV